ncbi:MAG: tetratricopeptide repeat protein [candidate division FCPU426 bacterium]
MELKTFSFLFFVVAASGASGADSVGLADAFFDARAYSLAVHEYEDSLRDEAATDKAHVRLRLGQGYQALGDPSRAAEAYQDFLDEDPSDLLAPQAWLGMGLSYQSAGRYAESQRVLGSMLQLYPRHPLAPQAAFGMAENFYHQGLYADAEKAYGRVEQDYPATSEPAKVVYARAWSLFAASQGTSMDPEEKKSSLSRASKLFSSVVERWPDSELAPLALYQKGECDFASGDYASALEAYDGLETRYPGHGLVPAAHYSAAWCVYQRGEWREASGLFQRFTAMYSEHELAPWAAYLAGVSLARAGDLEGAKPAYQLAIRKYPGSEIVERARYGLAWLATIKRDFLAAVDADSKFLEAYPDSPLAPSALFLRADAEVKLERFASARADYATLMKKFPSSPVATNARFFLASCYLAEGDAINARDQYREFRRLQGPSNPFYAEAGLREADAMFEAGQFGESEQAYAALLSSKGSPQVPGARYGLAWIAFQQKRWQDSASQWKRLAEDFPQHPLAAESLLHAGDSQYNLSRYEDALALYRRAAKSGAGTLLEAQARYQAGWAGYRMKNFDQAHADWSIAAAKFPDEARAAESRYWMAWALFRKGEFVPAAAAFADLAQRYPQSTLVNEATLRQADSLYNAKSYEEAIALYKGLVTRAPKDSRVAAALHGIQWCYYALGRDEEAVAASKEFLQKYQKAEFAPEIQFRVAEHYLNRGDFGKAEKELDALKNNYPGSSVDLGATYWRGQARFKNLQFNKAIQDWKQVVEKAPGNPLAPRAQFKIGMAYYRLQEYPEALEAFAKTLDAYGNTLDVAADAQFNRGMTFKRMQKDKDAEEAYAAVIKDYPLSPLANMARIRIGYIHEDAGRFEQAIAAYKDLASHDPGKLGAEAQFLVGDCLVAQKKLELAVAAYQEVADRFKSESNWAVTALARVAELQEQAGQDAKALATYQRIIAGGGNAEWTNAARKRIETIKARLKAAEPATAPPAAAKTKIKRASGVLP